MPATTGLVYFDDRDIATDFSIALTEFSGFPGMLGSAPRDVPLLDGPEISGALLDSRLIRRKSTRGTVGGIIQAASITAAMTTLDALRAVVGLGEIAVRSIYAPGRECLAVCDTFEGEPYQSESVDGWVKVKLGFVVKDGVAQATTATGLSLSTVAVACPIGTAESRPTFSINGNGGALTNPVITVRNHVGTIVYQQTFTMSLGASDSLTVDCVRTSASKVVAGVASDALAAGYWTSGEFPVLRPYDALVEVASYPTVELSSSTGTPVGTIAYNRRYL